MKSVHYWVLGCAAVLIAISVLAVLGRVRGMPRHFAWMALLMGAGTILQVVRESRDRPGEAWVEWVGLALMTVGVIVSWRGNRRHRGSRAPI